MSSAKTVSISLPSDLLVEAQALAKRENCSVSELFGEALRRYMLADKAWEALLGRTRAAGNARGIGSEADVERLSDEFRREKRQRQRG